MPVRSRPESRLVDRGARSIRGATDPSGRSADLCLVTVLYLLGKIMYSVRGISRLRVEGSIPSWRAPRISRPGRELRLSRIVRRSKARSTLRNAQHQRGNWARPISLPVAEMCPFPEAQNLGAVSPADDELNA